MKKLALILTLGIVMAACNPAGFDVAPNDFDADGVADSFTITLADGTVIQACNQQEYTIYAGQTIVSGKVLVSNDKDNLYVTYSANTGFSFNTVHLWLGTSLDLLPVPKNGQNTCAPIPGQFPWQYNVAGGTEYTFTIPLADIEAYTGGTIGCDSKLFIVAHSEVNTPGGGKETGFAGSIAGTCQRWYFYDTYTGKCCEPPQPPTGYTQTAFAKGGYVFTSDRKSNPENLPSLKLTRNRWGWAINLTATGESTYQIWAGAGLNYTSKGTLVGSLTVNWDGSNVTVTYNMNPGFSMEGVHVYADDFRPTTIAPGQYGNIANFNPNATTYTATYSVADTNTDGIWIIAHAGVNGNY